MSRGANALDFHCCSSWNQSQEEPIGGQRAGLLVRESTSYMNTDTCDYECVLVEQDLVSESFLKAPLADNFVTPLLPCGPDAALYTLVLGNQYGLYTAESFSHQPRPDEISHLSLIKAMETRLSSEAIDRIARISIRFQKNILTLLRLMKPISHT